MAFKIGDKVCFIDKSFIPRNKNKQDDWYIVDRKNTEEYTGVSDNNIYLGYWYTWRFKLYRSKLLNSNIKIL
jgi:hypothetical protein